MQAVRSRGRYMLGCWKASSATSIFFLIFFSHTMATVIVFGFLVSCVGSISLMTIHLRMVMTDSPFPQKQQNAQTQSLSARLSPSMKILTTLSMIGFAISILIGGVNHFTCISMLSVWTPIFYQMGKCCIYIGLIMRILYLYSDLGAVGLYTDLGAVQLRSHRYIRFVQIYGILLLISCTVLGIFGSLSIETHEQLAFGDGDGFIVCRDVYDKRYFSGSMFVDIVSTVVLLTIYAFPLIIIMRYLKRKFNSESYSYSGKDFKDPLTKTFILILVSTVSSVSANAVALFAETDIVFFICIPLNMLCVMLMAPYYQQETYERICCGFIKLTESVDECCSRQLSSFSFLSSIFSL